MLKAYTTNLHNQFLSVAVEERLFCVNLNFECFFLYLYQISLHFQKNNQSIRSCFAKETVEKHYFFSFKAGSGKVHAVHIPYHCLYVDVSVCVG